MSRSFIAIIDCDVTHFLEQTNPVHIVFATLFSHFCHCMSSIQFEQEFSVVSQTKTRLVSQQAKNVESAKKHQHLRPWETVIYEI